MKYCSYKGEATLHDIVLTIIGEVVQDKVQINNHK